MEEKKFWLDFDDILRLIGLLGILTFMLWIIIGNCIIGIILSFLMTALMSLILNYVRKRQFISDCKKRALEEKTVEELKQKV